MSFNCGIVGLPNVGKSTLFNSILNVEKAISENYPFCTIDPNIGRVPVPDKRIKNVANITGSKELIYNLLEIVDIAGLVKGASKGEGLGNKFLAHIKDVDAILHVVRCFRNIDIQHVNNIVDPLDDIEVINLELLLADIQIVESVVKKAKENKGDLEIILQKLNDGIPARNFIGEFNQEITKSLNLITSKPMLYVCNVEDSDVKDGNDLTELVKNKARNDGQEVIIISAKFESDLIGLSDDEKIEMLRIINLEESGLDMLILTGYKLLNLITFFTTGPKETRAWTITRGSTAPEAAAKIHSDFQKHFIKASVISYDDYVLYNGESGCKNAGKSKIEGKEYIVQDGDIIEFKHNA